MTVNEKTALTLLAVGIVLILVSLPLYLGKIKRNSVYGFRISQAFESEENWYAINRYGAGVLMLWSVVLAVFGIACLYVQPQNVMTIANIGFLSIGVPIVLTFLFARTL
ncbi:MAG: SdpI family protein [Syntrophaceae bacterium]|nr:SdpI family protein [Syntrophaceae bacterium]